ncbi:hypothetical protein PLESTM_000066600 [Pleodorina starrii]|nr:hypothetical protein PLESTM_000066600 [Pleodorina starrii]
MPITLMSCEEWQAASLAHPERATTLKKPRHFFYADQHALNIVIDGQPLQQPARVLIDTAANTDMCNVRFLRAFERLLGRRVILEPAACDTSADSSVSVKGKLRASDLAALQLMLGASPDRAVPLQPRELLVVDPKHSLYDYLLGNKTLEKLHPILHTLELKLEYHYNYLLAPQWLFSVPLRSQWDAPPALTDSELDSCIPETTVATTCVAPVAACSSAEAQDEPPEFATAIACCLYSAHTPAQQPCSAQSMPQGASEPTVSTEAETNASSSPAPAKCMSEQCPTSAATATPPKATTCAPTSAPPKPSTTAPRRSSCVPIVLTLLMSVVTLLHGLGSLLSIGGGRPEVILPLPHGGSHTSHTYVNNSHGYCLLYYCIMFAGALTGSYRVLTGLIAVRVYASVFPISFVPPDAVRWGPLAPALYTAASSAPSPPLSAIVAGASLDPELFLALGSHYASAFVCARVRAKFVTDAHPGRESWLSRLEAAGRLLVLLGDPGSLWVFIFATAEMRKMLVSPKAGPSFWRPLMPVMFE